jgi:hypothetical protein
LLGDRIPESQRKAVGWTLAAIGAIGTIPLVVTVTARSRHLVPSESQHDRLRHRRFESDARHDLERAAMDA